MSVNRTLDMGNAVTTIYISAPFLRVLKLQLCFFSIVLGDN